MDTKRNILIDITTNCPNYDAIVSFIVPKGDIISNQIRDDYTNFVTTSVIKKENIDVVRRFDEIMGEYVKKGKFYKLIQKTYGSPLKDDSGFEFVTTNFYELLDLIYSTYQKSEITTPRKQTIWI